MAVTSTVAEAAEALDAMAANGLMDERELELEKEKLSGGEV